MNIFDFLFEQKPSNEKEDGDKNISTAARDENENNKSTPTQNQNNQQSQQQTNPYGADNPSMNVSSQNVMAPTQTGMNQYDPSGPEMVVSDDPIENINKMFRLKKIFGKTQSLKKIINKFSDPRYDNVKEKIIEANDILVNILIPNLPTYSEKIDDIMKYYEEFLLNSYREVNKIYDSINNRSNDNVSDK